MKKLLLTALGFLLLASSLHAQTVAGNLADGTNFGPTANATSGANFNSNRGYFIGSCWNGTTFVADTFQAQVVEGTGSNPTSTFAFTSPSGCSGTHAYTFDNSVTAPAFFGSTSGATGFAGLGTATLVLGAAAGTGPSAVTCVSGVVCDSFSGTFAFTTGTGAAAGALGTITLPGTRTNVPTCLVRALSVSGALSTLGEYTSPANSSGTVTLPITTTGNPTSSNAYRVWYGCFGI